MYYEPVSFAPGMSLAWEGLQLGRCPLHCHKDVIEIVMVVRGRVRLTVSFECFELNQGDYVVIRERDSHALESMGADSEVVSLYFRMNDYLDRIPYLYSVLFCCESFDLAKYKNETAKIRNLILGVLIHLIQDTAASRAEAQERGEELLWILVNDYDMCKYYNRKWDVPFSRMEKYYTIAGYLFTYFNLKNPVEYIARQEHYSKSYLVHLFKDVAACSLKWALDYVRLFRAEELLLSTDLSIHEIADRCGYSDVKYYTTSFKKWFRCTPSEYRRKAQLDMSQPSRFVRMTSAQSLECINELVRMDLAEPSYRAAVTPISQRLFGEAEEGNNSVADDSGIRRMNAGRGRGRLIPLGDARGAAELQALENTLRETEDMGWDPILLLDRRNMSEEEFERILTLVAAAQSKDNVPNLELLVLYGNPAEGEDLERRLTETDKLTPGFRFRLMLADL